MFYLHSTMLLLIPGQEQFTVRRKVIYIPLCFYLYRSSLLPFLMCQSYLHSTMLLLIPSPFHSPRVSGKDIYIPLCFYLYWKWIDIKGSTRIFTFHYASTYTVVCASDQIDHIRIYIPLCFYLYHITGVQ